MQHGKNTKSKSTESIPSRGRHKSSSESASTSSTSFAESSLDESREPRRKRFSRFVFGNESSLRRDLEDEREVTPGSLEVWLDLPDEIKHDPMLAPFKHLYEQQHGRLETPPPDVATPSTENDRTFSKREPILTPIGEASPASHGTATGLLHHHTEDKEKKENLSERQRKVQTAYRVLKLGALIACWIFLTVALLLNQERDEVVLHTAVAAENVKVCELIPSSARKVQVELKGPFLPADLGNGTHGKFLFVWLHWSSDEDNWQRNSTRWKIKLAPEDELDFAPGEKRSRILEITEPGAATTDHAHRHNTTNAEEPDLGSENGTLSLQMHTTSGAVVPLTLSYQLNPMDPKKGIIYAAVLLCLLYILIIFEIVNRTLAALLSSSLGVAVLALGGARPTLADLVSWLDVETLLLLFSMMLLVAILAETGLFDYLAVVAFELTGGRTWPLINCLCFFTAIMSTFLDNVTTVLLMTPVTIRLCEVMQLNPVPVLMSMVIYSNVGGSATPVGDPPNVIIASHPAVIAANINFTTFTLHMTAGIIFVCIQTYFQLRFMYRDMNKLRHSLPTDIQELRQEVAVWRRAAASLASYSRDEELVRKALQKKVDKLSAALARREAGGGTSPSDPVYCATLAHMKQKYRIRDGPLLIKATVCVTFVVVVFFLHAIPVLQRLSLGWTALLGALLLLLLAEREDLEPILARVEWSTLLFFAALFVLMEALSKLGLIQWIGNWTETIILQVGEESRLAVAILLVLWVSGLASAFVDNIPLTTMMIRVTTALGDSSGLALPLQPLIWALSFGACLGGNGTLIGASANVVCAGVAEQHGYRFTFMQFLKVGFPIMIGNLIVVSVYLLLAHCAFQWH